jgi:PAS domain S-box-containing protein
MSVDSLAGQHVRDIEGEEVYALLQPHLERAAGGEFLTFQAKLPYLHGGARDVDVTLVPDRSGLPLSGLFAIVTDVSRQKATERAGRDEIMRLLRIVEAAPAMSYTFGADGRIAYATPAWEQFFGMKVEDSRDWQRAGLVHPDDLPDYLDSWRDALATGQLFEGEFRARRHDGEYRWLLSRSVPIADPTGRVEQWVAVNFDIHDRKLLEAEQERVARELERAFVEAAQTSAHLDSLIRNTPIGIDLVDRDLRFVRVNDAAAEINGLTVEEHIGRRVADLLPHLEGQVEMLTRVFERGETISEVEVHGMTPKAPGLMRYWLASYYPVPGPDGSIQGAGVLFREITEEKRHAEERERLLEDLRPANATKDEFLGLISHELKTPITTILGNAQILRTKGERLDADSRATALYDIESEAQRLHGIIENLLVLARLDRGQELAIEPVFVRRILRETIDDFIQKTNRRIELDVPDRYAFVMADAVYIRQVVENLLSNAHKYSPQEEPVIVSAALEGTELCVRVIDHGVGFTDEEAALLFQPFYRAERTARDVSGVGIGLAVCNRIIEALGGRMWAASGNGGGAEIGFALPLAEDETLGE